MRIRYGNACVIRALGQLPIIGQLNPPRGHQRRNGEDISQGPNGRCEEGDSGRGEPPLSAETLSVNTQFISRSEQCYLLGQIVVLASQLEPPNRADCVRLLWREGVRRARLGHGSQGLFRRVAVLGSDLFGHGGHRGLRTVYMMMPLGDIVEGPRSV
jgi:hypothetical protein